MLEATASFSLMQILLELLHLQTCEAQSDGCDGCGRFSPTVTSLKIFFIIYKILMSSQTDGLLLLPGYLQVRLLQIRLKTFL